jgi:histone-lysine N-methyltransferase SETMAR
MKTDENVDKVRTLVRNDRRLSIRMIAEELNVDKETVRQILTENLKMKKACAKMVPKNLSEDQKLNREEMCQNVLEKIEEDPDFLNSVVTCDETWFFQYDPETKRQSVQWKTTHSPRPKNARMSKSKIKTMLVVFFDIQGIIMTQYVPPGQTVNQTYYIELSTKLRGKIRRKRPELWKNGWILHHDNAPAHNALSARQFLAKKQVPVLHHAPY